MPNLKTASITIESYWNNASSEEIANEVLYPIAQQLKQLKHAQDIASFANPGYGYTQISFASIEHADKAREEVNALLNGISDLPDGVKRPYISEGIESDATGWIFLESEQELLPVSDQLEYVEKQLLPKIKKIEGIRTAYVLNRYSLQKKIIISLDFDLLRKYGYTVKDIAERLNYIGNYSLGNSIEKDKKISLRVKNEFSLTDLEKVNFRTKDNKNQFHLGDIAKIKTIVPEKVDTAYYNGKDVIPIVFYINENADLYKIYQEVKKLKNNFNNKILVNSAYKISDFGSPIDVIEKTRKNLILSMMIGLAFTAIFIFIYYRSLLSCLSILVFIPFVFLFILVVYKIFGIPLNIISITGIAIATGVILDPAIIISERLRKQNYTSVSLNSDLIKCLLLASGTTISVFIPLLAIESTESKLFSDLGVGFIAAVVVSTLMPVLILPKLAHFTRGSSKTKNKTSIILQASLKKLSQNLEGKVKTSWFLMISIGVSLFYILPPVEYLPHLNNGTSTVYFRFPQNLDPLEVEKNYIKTLSEKMNRFEKTDTQNEVFLRFWSGGGYGFFRHGEEKEIEQYKESLKKFLGEGLEGFRSAVFSTNLLANYGGDKSITIDIVGTTEKDLKQALSKIQSYFNQEKKELYTQITPNPLDTLLGVDISIDYAALSRHQVSEVEVISLLKSSCSGLYIKEVIHEQSRLEMYLAPNKCMNIKEITSLPLINALGQTVYISDIVKLKNVAPPQSILLKNGQRAHRLTIHLEKHHDSQLELQSINIALDSLLQEFKGKVTYELTEDSKKIDKLLKKGAQILLYVLLINMLLVCWLCRSLTCGLLVFLGYIPAVFGSMALVSVVNLVLPISFDVITLLGVVLMIGIVSNGYIIIAQSFINNIRNNSTNTIEKAMSVAVSERLRPIIITTLSTAFAMLPLMLSSNDSSILYRGLSTVLIGGILVGTVMSVTILPNIGTSLYRMLKRIKCE